VLAKLELAFVDAALEGAPPEPSDPAAAFPASMTTFLPDAATDAATRARATKRTVAILHRMTPSRA